MRKIDLNNFQSATSSTTRDINRRIVLNLIRKHQPVSRADISRHSRLQRSTVSSITKQLIEERWVTMGAFGDLPRGRKPSFLHLNGDRLGVVGVDIRPMETTIALADSETRFLTQQSIPTGDDPNRFVDELCKRVCKMMASHAHISFEGIGVALPGRVDLASGRLVFAPNLGWHAVDLKGPLEAATGLKVELENAANACALAEIWSGLHSEKIRNLVAVTVSEGIGVGMILNGQIVRGSTGLAGEFGHITIHENGLLCKCGNRGCLEAYGSNTAAVRYFNEASHGRKSQPETKRRGFEMILELAGQGDKAACEALDRMAHYLGGGVSMIAMAMAPDVIIMVGEVTRAWKRVSPIIDKIVAERMATGMKPRIVPTDPSTQPRLRGTIALVLQKYFGVPDTI